MKLLEEEVMTTTEVMEELFGMDQRMIYNISEKMRYQKIYEYLVAQEAEKLGTKEGEDNTYTVFKYQDELYLIPEKVFDESDEAWVEEVVAEEEIQEVVAK